MRKIFFLFTFLFAISLLYAAKVDTIYVNSPSMNKDVQVVVVTPVMDNQNITFPTLYLLHGYSGNAYSWI